MLLLQDYIRDLEKEEEEQKKIQKVFLCICFFSIFSAHVCFDSDNFLHIKEQLRRAERKNRDAFRMMLEEHIAAGTITAKTSWREYCQKVHTLSSFLIIHISTFL